MQDAFYNFHKALGVLTLILMVLRLINRLVVGAPIADPFKQSAHVVELLRARARALGERPPVSRWWGAHGGLAARSAA